ncbi:MAG: hypothetical protein HY787_12490 [Deltaproteobacteria bacterium]|nr:hypothetical protein [Deltaproteobacteria bacterium]
MDEQVILFSKYTSLFIVTTLLYLTISEVTPELAEDHKSGRFDFATEMGCDLSYDLPSGWLGERG